jgi:hypothetical protein
MRSSGVQVRGARLRESAIRIVTNVVLGLFALLVFLVFVSTSDLNRDTGASLSRMMAGTANRPFVYRVLTPAVLRGLVAITPAGVKARMEAYAPDFHAALPNVAVEPGYLYATILLLGLIYLSFVGFAVSTKALYAALCPDHGRWLFLVPFLALYGLPPFFQRAYLYDIPALFLFTLALTAMAKERWASYLCVFFLGCLNRETAILLILVFFAHYVRRLPRRSFVGLLTGQGAIAAGVRLVITTRYAANPGGVAEFHLLDFLAKYAMFYSFDSAVAWVLILTLLLYRWEEKPLFLRHGLWILVPLFGLYFTFGMPREIRVFYEAYPILVLLVVHSVLTVLHERSEDRAARGIRG